MRCIEWNIYFYEVQWRDHQVETKSEEMELAKESQEQSQHQLVVAEENDCVDDDTAIEKTGGANQKQ